METPQPHSFLVKPGKFGLLMSDLRGFTALSTQYPIEQLAPFLDVYFRTMTDLIARHGGVIDKFMGDSIFALFAVENLMDTTMALTSCSVDMQLAMDEVNDFGATLGLPEIFMGIGLNCGDIVTCTLGSGIYQEQTVLGDAVNLTARIAAFALRGQVLMSEDVYQATNSHVEAGPVFKVLIKGRKQPLTVQELIGTTYPVAKAIPIRENRKGPRVEVVLPISYHLIEEQRIRTTSVKADIIDLSYGGMRILTPNQHQMMDEIKIVVPFGAGTSKDGGDVYAKILSCIPENDGTYCISTEFSYLDESTRKSIRSLVDHLA